MKRDDNKIEFRRRLFAITAVNTTLASPDIPVDQNVLCFRDLAHDPTEDVRQSAVDHLT